jgi:hypothetical protein
MQCFLGIKRNPSVDVTILLLEVFCRTESSRRRRSSSSCCLYH